MSTAIAIRSQTTAAPMTLAEIQNIGPILAKSGFFQDTRDAAQAIVKVMAGAELGFPAIASMTGIYIVKGRISLSANLMAAAIKKTDRYNYKVAKGHPTPTECSITFFEKTATGWEEIGTSSLTMTQAKAANMHQEWDKEAKSFKDKATWKNFPANMLFARAMSNGARWFCPDIFGGVAVYTPDEVEVKTDGEGNYIDAVVEPVDPDAQAKAEVLAALKNIYEANGAADWDEYAAKQTFHNWNLSQLKSRLAKWQDAAIKKAQAADPLASQRDEADELIGKLEAAGLDADSIMKLMKGIIIAEETDEKKMTALIVRLKSALNELAESEVQKAVGF